MKKTGYIIGVIVLIFLSSCNQLPKQIPEAELNSHDMFNKDDDLKEFQLLENQIREDTGLEDVVVVVRGQEVFVGINMVKNKNYGRNLVQKIDDLITKDPRYTYVYISNETKIIDTLKVIRREVYKGIAVEYYNDELNKIRDLMTI